MENDLKEKMRDVALEYMRKVADLLGKDSRDCHWVGTDNNERGIYTVCDLGDITFLTLDQMQVIIDRLPEWLKRYKTTEGVAQEIDDWMEWSIKEENMIDGHPRINLEHWLMGCPRERLGTGHEFDNISDTSAFDNFKKMMEDEQ